MPDAAVRYSSSELELCGLKKSIIHCQYFFKYASLRVLMDHSALNFFFQFEHALGKNMFVSDFLSRFSNNNDDGEAIPFVTDTSSLRNTDFMEFLDNKCRFDYSSSSGVCTEHSYPVTCSQTKGQKIQMPSIFSNPPVNKKSVTAPIIKNISVSKPALGSSSSKIASLPSTTTHTSQPPVIQQVHKLGRPRKIRVGRVTNMED